MTDPVPHQARLSLPIFPSVMIIIPAMMKIPPPTIIALKENATIPAKAVMTKIPAPRMNTMVWIAFTDSKIAMTGMKAHLIHARMVFALMSPQMAR